MIVIKVEASGTAEVKVEIDNEDEYTINLIQKIVEFFLGDRMKVLSRKWLLTEFSKITTNIVIGYNGAYNDEGIMHQLSQEDGFYGVSFQDKNFKVKVYETELPTFDKEDFEVEFL